MPHVARSPRIAQAAEHLLPGGDCDAPFWLPPPSNGDPSCFNTVNPIAMGTIQNSQSNTAPGESIDSEVHAANDACQIQFEEAAPWGLVLNTVLYMASPMSMPATMAAAGWTWGSIFLAYSSFISYQTGMLLGDICSRMPHLGSFPAIALRCGGQVAMWTVVIMQFLTFWIDSSAQMLYCAQYLGQLLPSLNICQSDWLFIVAVATLPLMQIPTYHQSRWFALPTFGVLMIILVVFFYEACLIAPWQCTSDELRRHSPSYPEPSIRSILLSGSAFAYSYGGHGMFPEEIRELRDKTQWNRIIMPSSYAIIIPMYVSTSVLGFYVWGGGDAGANANINANFPQNAANKASIIVQLVLTYYLIFFTSLCLSLNLEIALGIDPSSCCTAKADSEGRRPSTSASRSKLASWCLVLPPFVSRGLLRSLLVATQVGLCQMLLAGEGDTLLALQSLSGALGMAAFTYSLPFVFYWILFPADVGIVKAIWYSINGALGIAIMLTGIYSALYELADSSFSIGGGICDINSDQGDYYRGCNSNRTR